MTETPEAPKATPKGWLKWIPIEQRIFWSILASIALLQLGVYWHRSRPNLTQTAAPSAARPALPSVTPNPELRAANVTVMRGYFAQAFNFQRQGKHAEAIAMFQRGIDLDPAGLSGIPQMHQRVLLDMARSYEATRSIGSAINKYREVTYINPASPEGISARDGIARIEIIRLQIGTSVYVGTVSDGNPHGMGTITYNNGDRYEGLFQSGQKMGQGTYIWANGDRFVGEFRTNEPYSGCYRYSNGTTSAQRRSTRC